MDRAFFIAEIETCTDMMYRVAWSILRNEADVQDALQDAVLKAWEKRDKLREEKYFRTWMTRILINVCYDTQRIHRKYDTSDDHTSIATRYGKLLIAIKCRIPTVLEDATPGEKLRYYRELRMLSQEQLGTRIGMTSHGILNYEKGLNPIYYEEAVKLGQILNVAPEKLLDDYSRFCMPGYGNRIRTIRKLYGLSQVQFAKMTGWNRATISIWEKEIGGHHPNKEAYRRLLRLAGEKGVKINDT